MSVKATDVFKVNEKEIFFIKRKSENYWLFQSVIIVLILEIRYHLLKLTKKTFTLYQRSTGIEVLVCVFLVMRGSINIKDAKFVFSFPFAQL